MTTLQFDHVFVKSEAVVVGKMEKEGPLGKYFDLVSTDPYFNQKSYEQAEIEMNRMSVASCLKKAQISSCDLVYAADLINQISSHYLAKEINKRDGLYANDPYHEDMNKYIKISSYLKAYWNKIEWLEDTDPDYMNEILDYTENAEHDDSPDSAASMIRKFVGKGKWVY